MLQRLNLSVHRLCGTILVSGLFLLMTGTPVYAQTGQTVHTVQPGETLYRIALQYGVSADQIAAANGLADPSLIYPGQALIIPVANEAGSSPTPADRSSGASMHLVQAGETLVSIARRYGVSEQDLAAANQLQNGNLIYVGQHLIIPGAGPDQPPTSVPHNIQLNVPLYGQLHSLSCEAAAARMMASYYGIAQEEGWFQSAFGANDNPHLGFRGNVDGVFGWINDYGTYAEPVIRVLQIAGVSTTIRYGMTYDELRAALDQGAPTIVWTSPRSDVHDVPEGYRLIPEEHTYVVVGYNDAGFIVNDPLYGGRRLQMATIPGWEAFGNMAVVGPIDKHRQ